MPAGRAALPLALALTSLAGLGAAGCGSSATQAADEPRGDFPVEVVKASFPTQQQLAESSKITFTVRNAGTKPLPDLAVTLDSLTQRTEGTGLATDQRPVWVVDRGPKGADSALTNTWSLPTVPAGQTRTMTWDVTAEVPGRHEVRWRVAAGLDGKARAVLQGGGVPEGRFVVDVSDKPDELTIDPDSGAVVDQDGATVAAGPSK